MLEYNLKIKYSILRAVEKFYAFIQRATANTTKNTCTRAHRTTPATTEKESVVHYTT